MSQQTMNLVDDAGLSALHVFPFSARHGTPAARMPQVDRLVVKDRATRLRTKSDAATRARLAGLCGTTQTLLIEKGGIGRTACFAAVRSDAAPGSFIMARIAAAVDGTLIAAPAA
jgi:threonylcarbamoyladenosine tRNA methylthiotransferase MtaB